MTDSTLAADDSEVSVPQAPDESARAPAPPDTGAGAGDVGGASARALLRPMPSRAARIVLLAGLVVTAALSLTCLGLYEANERRLLDLRVRQLGLVLTSAVPSVQTPLASAAELADTTGGDAQKFEAFMAPYVGPGRQYASASLWPLGESALSPVARIGSPPQLDALPGGAAAFFARAAQTRELSVVGILHTAQPSVGYEFNTPGVKAGFAVYAEDRLTKSRRSKREADPAFADLNYVVYLGRTRSAATLLVTNLKRLPSGGREASDAVPFGDTYLTLVVTPHGSLGGTFFEDLPWIFALGGVLISLAAALLTDRLARGRQRAERLAVALDSVASENRRMYSEQRTIAQTLQHALLPDSLPQIRGLAVSARYVPAASGVDVGGDWYDVLVADDRRVLLVIGDVSGHGLRAATTMASIRHAALAYATEDPRPGAVLAKLSGFVDKGQYDHFATVLCVLIDVDAHLLTLASAGHPPPLLIDGAHARFLDLDLGTPIGVPSDSDYRELTVSVPARAIVLAFTDGLVERRGEVIDAGLERLRAAAVRRRAALDDLVAGLAHELVLEHHDDDTAILGIEWQE
jgi:serine phosphatase RsbU (regulator of sigma subunit)